VPSVCALPKGRTAVSWQGDPGSSWPGKVLAELALGLVLLASCTLKLDVCRWVTGEGGG